ncbi:unnamed protein product [Musa textilis]
MENYDFVRSTQILKCCIYLIYGAERFRIRLDILFLVLEPILGIVLFVAVEKCFLSPPSHGCILGFCRDRRLISKCPIERGKAHIVIFFILSLGLINPFPRAKGCWRIGQRRCIF